MAKKEKKATQYKQSAIASHKIITANAENS